MELSKENFKYIPLASVGLVVGIYDVFVKPQVTKVADYVGNLVASRGLNIDMEEIEKYMQEVLSQESHEQA